MLTQPFLIEIAFLVASIVMLYFGAEFALEAAEKVGKYFGLSPLVIGLFIVGFGTSLPEFFVSQLACFRGESDIALGNIVGSNIANIFLILALAGIIEPLYIQRKEIKEQFVLHLILTMLLSFLLLQKKLYIWGTCLLAAFFAYYLFDTFKQMSKQRQIARLEEDDKKEKLSAFEIGKLIAGFSLLYFGGELLVSSGSKVGKMMGISSYVISAVFVAFGTSFPELVTAMLACIKKKNTDLITGNIIGSNIFNVSFVMTSIGIYDVSINKDFFVEISVLLFAAVTLLGLILIKKNFSRAVGSLFFAIYLGVVYYWVS